MLKVPPLHLQQNQSHFKNFTRSLYLVETKGLEQNLHGFCLKPGLHPQNDPVLVLSRTLNSMVPPTQVLFSLLGFIEIMTSHSLSPRIVL